MKAMAATVLQVAVLSAACGGASKDGGRPEACTFSYRGDAASGVGSDTMPCATWTSYTGTPVEGVYELDDGSPRVSFWSGHGDGSQQFLSGIDAPGLAAMPAHADTLSGGVRIRADYGYEPDFTVRAGPGVQPAFGTFEVDLTSRTPVTPPTACPDNAGMLYSGCAIVHGRIHAVLVPYALSVSGTVTMDWTF